jgi:hypothetical protein
VGLNFVSVAMVKIRILVDFTWEGQKYILEFLTFDPFDSSFSLFSKCCQSSRPKEVVKVLQVGDLSRGKRDGS